MDDLDQQYEENLRSMALDFVTKNYQAHVSKGHEKIRECLKQIGQEIELVTDNEKKLLEWYKQRTGSDDAAKIELRRLTRDLRSPPWRSARYNLSIPLVIERTAVASGSSPEDIAPLAPLPHTPGPSNIGSDQVEASAGSSRPVGTASENTVSLLAERKIVVTATDTPNGRQPLNGGTPVGPSRKRKMPHDEAMDTMGALRSLESRAFVQGTEVFGRSFAFEYPKDTGNFCIVKCNDCGWVCEMNPEKTPATFENHWLISSFHRDLNYRENRRPLRIREILEQHTYRVAGATRQWVTENNCLLKDKKNAAKHPGGSQAPQITPQSTKPNPGAKPSSGSKPSSHRAVARGEKSYQGRVRGNVASEKYELRPRANRSPAGGQAGGRSSSSSLSSPLPDDDEETIVVGVLETVAVGARESEELNQENGSEFTLDDFTPGEIIAEGVVADEVTPDEVECFRTVARQFEDMPTAAGFEEKSSGDIKTEPGLDSWHQSPFP